MVNKKKQKIGGMSWSGGFVPFYFKTPVMVSEEKVYQAYSIIIYDDRMIIGILGGQLIIPKELLTLIESAILSVKEKH